MHQQRDLFLDYVRVLSTVGVVAIHCDSVTASLTNYVGGISWWLVLAIHSVAICSVPLFAMISGALLARKHFVSFRYVLKKSNYFLFLLVTTYGVYKAWEYYQHGTVFNATAFLFDVLYVNVGHLYYLAIAACLYLCAPLVMWIARKQLLLTITIVLIAAATLYEHTSYLVFSLYNSTTIFFIGLPFLSYFCMGYLLSNIPVTRRQTLFSSVAFFGFAGIVTLLTAYNIKQAAVGNMTFWTPELGNFFWEPFTVPVLGLSIVAFYLLRSITMTFTTLDSNFINGVIRRAAPLTLGVYLVHPLIIELSETYLGLAMHHVTYSLFVYYVLKLIVVSVLSFCIVGVIRFAFQRFVLLLPIPNQQPLHHR